MEDLLTEYFRLGDLALNQASALLYTTEPISQAVLQKSKELNLIADTWYQAAKLLNTKLRELEHINRGPG